MALLNKEGGDNVADLAHMFSMFSRVDGALAPMCAIVQEHIVELGEGIVGLRDGRGTSQKRYFRVRINPHKLAGRVSAGTTPCALRHLSPSRQPRGQREKTDGGRCVE